MFCVLEKSVCSDPVAESVLHMSLRFSWSIVFLKSSVFLLIFFLVVLSIVESEIVKFPTIIVLLFLPSVLSKFASYLSALIVHLHFCS